MAKMSPGLKAFRANIRAMKKLAKDKERARAREAKANHKEHLKTMTARAAEAAAAAEQRRLEGIASRNAHNAMLAAEKAERMARRNGVKLADRLAA